MAVKLRLRREGGKKDPRYRIVAADSRSPRDGRFIEILGYYQPTADPSVVEVDEERVRYWLGVGARPTQPVDNLLRVAGVWQRLEAGEPPAGARGDRRTPPERGRDRSAAASQVTGGGDAPAEQAAAAPEEVTAAAGPFGGTPEDVTAAPVAETQPTSAPEGAPDEGVAAGASAPEQTPAGAGEEDA